MSTKRAVVRAGSCLLLGVIVVAGCSPADEPTEAVQDAPEGVVALTPAQVEASRIRSEVVDLQPIERPVRVPGTVMSPDTAHAVVGSVVEGRVERVLVLPGDRVRAGARLVELHAHEVADALKDQMTARAELTFHEAAAGRAERLYEAGAVSLEELERKRTGLEGARAEMARAEEMLEHLNASPPGTSAALAPRAGIVFEVYVSPGEVVLPGDPLVDLGSTEILWVTAFVPENTAAGLSPGDSVTVQFRSRPGERVRGRLIRMGEWVDPANRSVEVRFELDEIPVGIRPGSFATVDISGDEALIGAELPESAVVRHGDGDVVFVLEGPGRFRRVPVEAHPIREGRIAVVGIPQGADVVVEGAYFLKAALEVVPGEAEGH